ncbi:MAG TPA: sulfatase-like hydrolase/transferase, partial [Steroidobacteraceae bacterium]
RLRAAGVWDRAVVLIIGDNGEEFREHGYVIHGGPMHDEQARTLAILKLPKGDARGGTLFERPMSHIDFVPLLVQLAGLPEWNGFQGRSPFLASGDPPVFMLVNAVVREYDVVRWPWKLMRRTFPQRAVELYDLEADPRERHNLARALPHTVAQLSRDMESWRSCQLSYYADSKAYTQLAPPRYDR